MTISTVFKHKHSQAACLPDDVRFPDSVKKVDVRVVGEERIIVPAGLDWNSFFLSAKCATDDFMAERSSQFQIEREN